MSYTHTAHIPQPFIHTRTSSTLSHALPPPLPPVPHNHTHTSSSKRRETRTKCATSSATPALCLVAPLGPPSLLSSPSPSVCCAHDNKKSVRVTLTPTKKKENHIALLGDVLRHILLLRKSTSCPSCLAWWCARCSPAAAVRAHAGRAVVGLEPLPLVLEGSARRHRPRTCTRRRVPRHCRCTVRPF